MIIVIGENNIKRAEKGRMPPESRGVAGRSVRASEAGSNQSDARNYGWTLAPLRGHPRVFRGSRSPRNFFSSQEFSELLCALSKLPFYHAGGECQPLFSHSSYALAAANWMMKDSFSVQLPGRLNDERLIQCSNWMMKDSFNVQTARIPGTDPLYHVHRKCQPLFSHSSYARLAVDKCAFSW